jgi:hypothetical protein
MRQGFIGRLDQEGTFSCITVLPRSSKNRSLFTANYKTFHQLDVFVQLTVCVQNIYIFRKYFTTLKQILLYYVKLYLFSLCTDILIYFYILIFLPYYFFWLIYCFVSVYLLSALYMSCLLPL